MTQHWLKGLTKKELEELRKLKNRPRRLWLFQSAEDPVYFGMSLTLIVFSILFTQVIVVEDQLPGLQRNEITLFNEIGSEFQDITNIGGKFVKGFDELETYSFDCENFYSDPIFDEPGTYMPYFCALTGYNDELRGTPQKFEKTLSGIIYYYHLLHQKTVQEMDKEVAEAYQRWQNNSDKEELFDKWQELRDKSIEKDKKIESLLNTLASSLKSRIEKYSLSQTYYNLSQNYLWLSLLILALWIVIRTSKSYFANKR